MSVLCLAATLSSKIEYGLLGKHNPLRQTSLGRRLHKAYSRLNRTVTRFFTNNPRPQPNYYPSRRLVLLGAGFCESRRKGQNEPRLTVDLRRTVNPHSHPYLYQACLYSICQQLGELLVAKKEYFPEPLIKSARCRSLGPIVAFILPVCCVQPWVEWICGCRRATSPKCLYRKSAPILLRHLPPLRMQKFPPLIVKSSDFPVRAE